MSEPAGNYLQRPVQPHLFDLAPEEMNQEQRCIEALNAYGDEAGPGMGVYTGERLRKSNPEKYEAIAELLGHGLGIRTVARLTRSHHRTVDQVRTLEGVTIDTLKQELGRACMTGAALSAEALLDDLHDDKRLAKLSEYHKALVTGILTDKGQLLLGQATSRVEHHQVGEPGMDDYNAWLSGGAIDVEVDETGQAGGTDGQKEPAAALPAPDPEREMEEGALIVNQRISDPNTGTKGDLSGHDTTSDTTAAAETGDVDEVDADGQASADRAV